MNVPNREKLFLRGMGKKSRESCVKRGMCNLQAEKEVVRCFPESTVEALYPHFLWGKKEISRSRRERTSVVTETNDGWRAKYLTLVAPPVLLILVMNKY